MKKSLKKIDKILKELFKRKRIIDMALAIEPPSVNFDYLLDFESHGVIIKVGKN